MTNPLIDVIPAAARRYVYAAVALAALLFGAYQASDGDWAEFVGAVIATLVSATAASNTGTPSADESGAADVGLALLIVAVLGVALLLFGVRFDR